MTENANRSDHQPENSTPPKGGKAVEPSNVRPVIVDTRGVEFEVQDVGALSDLMEGKAVLGREVGKLVAKSDLPDGPSAELPEPLCRGMCAASLQSGKIQIDLEDMPPGSFPPEFIASLGEKRFRAALDVTVVRVETLGSVRPLQSVRLLATGRVTLEGIPPA